MVSVNGIHLETTNICTLKCPGCARTQFLEKFGANRWTNYQLNLADLRSFIDINISELPFMLCGNYGDSIYYHQLFDLINWIKSNNGIVNLATNGSYKTQAWWDELVSLLDERDSVTFGIDGTPDTFTQYRINGDWQSILLGINAVVASKAKSIWQYIPFAFNADTIDTARQIAVNLGVDHFSVLKSDRFDSTTAHLQPADSLIGDRHEKMITFYNGQRESLIAPECKKTNAKHYISAAGFYAPCCYVTDHRFFYASEFHKNKELYNISKTTLSAVLAQTQEFYQTLEEKKLKYCVFNCPQTK